jgi:hypothetical protein
MQPAFSVNTIKDLRAADATTRTDEQAVIVLGYHGPGDGGGGIFRWDEGATEADNRGMIIGPWEDPDAPPDPLPLGRWKRVYEGPISVRFFGARDDGLDPAGTRVAIQAAIDFAVNPIVSAHSAGVILFPARTGVKNGDLAEYKVDGPIVLPRLPYWAYMVLRGEGQRVSQVTLEIQNPDADRAPLMICDQALIDPEHPDDPAVKNQNGGSYLIEHLTLAVPPGRRAFDWSPPAGVDADKGRLEIHFNEMLFASGANSVVGLVHIQRGHRCRFYNCEFAGLDPAQVAGIHPSDIPYVTTGVAIWLEASAGTTIINARNVGRRGGFSSARAEEAS